MKSKLTRPKPQFGSQSVRWKWTNKRVFYIQSLHISLGKFMGRTDSRWKQEFPTGLVYEALWLTDKIEALTLLRFIWMIHQWPKLWDIRVINTIIREQNTKYGNRCKSRNWSRFDAEFKIRIIQRSRNVIFLLAWFSGGWNEPHPLPSWSCFCCSVFKISLKQKRRLVSSPEGCARILENRFKVIHRSMG